MTPKFTTPCFIRKNTHELCKKLEELGYTIMMGYDIGFIMTSPKNGVAYIPDGQKIEVSDDYGKYIDCGTNERLFLALAALREDSDKFQWFCDDEDVENKSMFFCKYDDVEKHIHNEMDGWDCEGFHKATPDELIAYFRSYPQP